MEIVIKPVVTQAMELGFHLFNSDFAPDSLPTQVILLVSKKRPYVDEDGKPYEKVIALNKYLSYEDKVAAITQAIIYYFQHINEEEIAKRWEVK